MKVKVKTEEELVAAGFARKSDVWVSPRADREGIGKSMSAYVGKTIEVEDGGKTHFFQTDDDSHWAWPREALILGPLSKPTSLFQACEAGDVSSVGELLGADATLANARETGGISPLHVAATEGHKDVVELLVRAGADVDAANQWGVTPLYLAAAGGFKEIAALLIAQGANVNVKEQRGETPLQVATRKGHAETASLLRGTAATEPRKATWRFWKK
jgi:hypothetical protein